MSKELIKTFIRNFNYLNAKGKRGGFFSCFRNGALTRDLEEIATNLRDELSALDQEQKKDDSTKCKEAISLVRDAFTKCEHVREDRAAWGHYRHETYKGPHIDCTTAGTSYDYKNPYLPSKFEKELIRGLEASISFLNRKLKIASNDEALQIKQEFCTLLYDVSHFSPQQIRKNEHSWMP